jgi:DNA repair protein RecN (Recombination protein N)
MLRFLRVTHLAVIDSVEVEFDAGLNVLTGETGAGKSILVEAVGLLLGGRASGDLVRTGEDAATIEAIFESGDAEIADIIVRREITAQGRSRAFINGSLTTAGGLKELAANLIEIHGQHEHQTLLDPSTHLGVLDAFEQLEPLVAPVRAAFDTMRASAEALSGLRRAVADRDARLELITFQLNELDRANLRAGGAGRAGEAGGERLRPRGAEDEPIRGEASASVRTGGSAPAPVEKSPGYAGGLPELEEDEELMALRQVLASAERVERLCEESYSSLYDSDTAILAALGHLWRRVSELAALDPKFQPYVDARDGIKAQLEDLALFLRRYADGIEASPARLQQIEERLALLDRLKRKYGPSLTDVIARRDALRRELEDLQQGDDRVAQLEREHAKAREQYLAAARVLGKARRQAAVRFARELERLLAELAMERTRFEVRFGGPDETVPEESGWTAAGIDVAEFFVSPNPGEDLRPLARIVSGGELSRIMLAIKTLTFGTRLRRLDLGPSLPGSGARGLIFDEVDAGIGGRVADVVGRKLQTLGSAFQVLCITHLPQIAAYADTHFQIDKRVDARRTSTTVRRLDHEGRVNEIARMLGGAAITEGLRGSAREMLGERGAGRKAKGESERAKGESGKSSTTEDTESKTKKRRTR